MTTYADRKVIYEQLEEERGSKILCIVTGDRPGWETQLSRDFADYITDHLDLMSTQRISVVLHTNGGDTLAAWRIAHLVRQFCGDFEVLVPLKALSAGTLLCLGADRVVMTKQASLGPIDPSVNGPLNPVIPGSMPPARAPVSVEAIRGYLEIAKAELAIKDDVAMATIFSSLSSQVHPIVLGQVFRARSQIQQLARRLLRHQISDSEKADAVIAFLCSESGSHDYSIDRKEAREMGLQVETPSPELYGLLRTLHVSYRDELQLAEPWDPITTLGVGPTVTYELKRCLIESISGGSHEFVSRGTLTRITVPPNPMMMPAGAPPEQIVDRRDFEGWRKMV